MTASERPANQPQPDAPLAVPGHPGRWRIVSLLAVAVAALLVIVSIAQDRRNGGGEALGQGAMYVTEVSIDPSLYSDAEIHASAGSTAGGSAVEQATNATMVPLTPLGLALVTASSSAGDLTGLVIHDPARDQTLLDGHSTAQSLLSLSPALLSRNVANATRSAELIGDDPMHVSLVEAVIANPALALSNDALASSLGALLDRVPLRSPTPDQGCDSVSSSTAYPLAGTCVQPGPTETTIHNEQDRWVLVYGEPDDWSTICTALPPAAPTTTARSVSSADCGSRALLLAAGQLPDADSRLADITSAILTARHDDATALMLLDDYVLPYAAVTAGVDGYNDRAAVTPAAVPVIVNALSQLLASDQLARDAVRAAYDPASTPAARQRAAVSAARAMLTNDDLIATLPTELGERSHALNLLSFYDFTASFMTAERTGPTWTATAAGIIEGL